MSNIVKNERIKQTMKTTRKRHQNMTCRVFELKLNARKMSKPQKEQLTTYFRVGHMKETGTGEQITQIK